MNEAVGTNPSSGVALLLERWRSYVLGRRRLLLGALPLALVALGAWRVTRGADEGSLERSFAAVLERDHIVLAPRSLIWIDKPSSPWSSARAVWLAATRGEATDVFSAEVRATREGKVVDVTGLANLTRTSGAEEVALTRLGRHVAYASLVDGKLDAITVLDLEGEPSSVTDDWSLRARMQNAITNVQETGQRAGVGRRRYRWLDPVAAFEIETNAGHFLVKAGARTLELDPSHDTPVRGAELVEFRPMTKGAPGTISWVVDTVRNSPWVGREPIEWLESRVFSARDWAERKWHAAFGSEDDTEKEVREELGVSQVGERRRIELSKTNAESGWPPAPMKTILNKVRGEGEWSPVVDDPFVKQWPGAPPLFYQSFLRVDPERTYTRVYVTVWDPRLLQLHIMTGTAEPESATGETGPGMAPRDPKVLERVVAGFNGGFQALHGEFGMMADGRVYLPPKPWAATVAVYRDGHVAMGSWMAPPKGVRDYEENWAVAQIPPDMLAMRQNLTSVVENGRYNPWERWWWGAAPLNATEQTLIDRSGLCLTKESFLAYFWGQSMSADALGAAMLAARCVRGIHLDMNSAHTGFEYYNVQRAPFPPLGRPVTDDEYDGPVPLAAELHLRARRMVRTMSTMRFPRYVGRDARDFFYLTLRSTLPGPPLAVAAKSDAGRFSADEMPSAGYPAAIARAHLGEAMGAGAWVVRLDPHRAEPMAKAPQAEGEAPPPMVLAYLTGGEGRGDSALYSTPELIARSFHVGRPAAGATVLVRGAPLEPSSHEHAALGVDGNGFIVYAEQEAEDEVSLYDRMRTAGALPAVVLPDTARLALSAGDLGFASPDAYEREVDPANAIAFVANTRPDAEVLFPDIKPRGYWAWARLQDARVRYFREGPARFQMPTDAGVPGDELPDGGTTP